MKTKRLDEELNKLGFEFSHPQYYCDVYYNNSMEKLEIHYEDYYFQMVTDITYKKQEFKTFNDFNVYLREEKFKELI